MSESATRQKAQRAKKGMIKPEVKINMNLKNALEGISDSSDEELPDFLDWS